MPRSRDSPGQARRKERAMRSIASRVLLSLAMGGVLYACEREPPPLPEQVRPIRTFTITEVASGQVRKFSGFIKAIDSSALSFEVGGNVRRVLVNQGDAVKRGQLLAVLDDEPYRLNVQAADAELQRARFPDPGASGLRPQHTAARAAGGRQGAIRNLATRVSVRSQSDG